jgi:kinesin family protein 2/24
MHYQRPNLPQESVQRIVSGLQAKKNREPLVVPLTSTFSKARIRSTYSNIFTDAISRFVPPIHALTCTDTSERFTVCARVRPLFKEETIRGDVYDCITTTDDTVTVHAGNLHLNKLEMKHITFHLDHVFGKNSSNQDVYNVVRKAIAKSIPQKDALAVDSTVFLYGKTGTGKSHTINGIAQLFVQDVFYFVKNSYYDVRIGISAVEIMAGTKGFIVSKDNVCDLYNNGALVYFREDASGTVHLRGATEYACDNSTQMDAYIKAAKNIRRTQETTRNPNSSRSHLIYFVRVRKVTDNLEAEEILSTITFVDLAGNEGQQDSLYHKGNSDQIKDSTSINRSLASLQDCIRTAADGSKVIPFRGSILTRLLKNCFYSKESKTVFIGTISGLPMDTEQSILTLKYTGLLKQSIQDFIIEQTVKLDATL